MIKQDQLKYHYYGPEMSEILWDLEQDPGETINLISNPTYADVLEQFLQPAATNWVFPQRNEGTYDLYK